MSRLLTYDEVAERLSVSRSTITRLVQQGKILVTRVSDRSPRIAERDLERYLTALAEAAQ